MLSVGIIVDTVNHHAKYLDVLYCDVFGLNHNSRHQICLACSAIDFAYVRQAPVYFEKEDSTHMNGNNTSLNYEILYSRAFIKSHISNMLQLSKNLTESLVDYQNEMLATAMIPKHPYLHAKTAFYARLEDVFRN